MVQGVLSRTLREGNRKTYIGSDGWLYLQAALDSLTGYGPLEPEPDSVAKDPNREPWRSPLDAITKFAAQLDELGVELVLVPIPVKPMIYAGVHYRRRLRIPPRAGENRTISRGRPRSNIATRRSSISRSMLCPIPASST